MGVRVMLSCHCVCSKAVVPIPCPSPPTTLAVQVGTFAIAYAAHKALSPVRFPPTVALTPMVAKWIGKKTDGDSN